MGFVCLVMRSGDDIGCSWIVAVAVLCKKYSCTSRGFWWQCWYLARRVCTTSLLFEWMHRNTHSTIDFHVFVPSSSSFIHLNITKTKTKTKRHTADKQNKKTNSKAKNTKKCSNYPHAQTHARINFNRKFSQIVQSRKRTSHWFEICPSGKSQIS